uniref:Uncharacterized protein n=1 Tax=Anguilla anguilla TaxID=7936 RepID=A0A0E9WRN2_ANGAN
MSAESVWLLLCINGAFKKTFFCWFCFCSLWKIDANVVKPNLFCSFRINVD